MSASQMILTVLALVIVIAGIWLVIRGSRRRDGAEMEQVSYDKNGIPIIPRHERNIIDDPDLDDAVAGETTIAPDRDYLQAVVDDDKSPSAHPQTAKATANQKNQPLTESYSSSPTDSPDAFSDLMSATDNLMPVIDTAPESAFTEQSPILDQHLLEAAEHEQNAPLFSAQDNINITILPQASANRAAIIRGRDLLALVDKYGLKFGAMNMFHRYQNKDGTGKLWFSMMGMTDHGIVPFDPHSVALNTYNGLVVFLSLPNPAALMGFDSMMSIAALMAKDLNAEVLDDNNHPVTAETKQQLRNFVRDYDEQY